MIKSIFAAAAAVALIGSASAANAAPILYNITMTQLIGNVGGGTGSFSIEGATFSGTGNEYFMYSGSPSGDQLLGLTFLIDGRTFNQADSTGGDQVFFQNGNLAGVTYVGVDGGNVTISLNAGALSYTYSDAVGGRVSIGTISATRVAAPAVPEPATWAMMIGGFGTIGGAMRYRRRKASVSFA